MASCPIADKSSNPDLTEPISCPMGHKSTGDSIKGKPLSYIDSEKVPVSNPSYNNIPSNVTSTKSIDANEVALPTMRQISSIPRSSGTDDGQDEYWVYPSQQQFYRAMKKKNYDPREDDMSVVVPIHNIVNERSWSAILKWEQKYKDTCGSPKLKSFTGKPSEPSPKARLYTLFGYTAPFDRHDWVVDRCGKDVRYVLDFYKGHNGDKYLDMNSSLFIDVRPALDSFEAAFDRISSFCGF